MEELKIYKPFITDLVNIVNPISISFDFTSESKQSERLNLRKKITKQFLHYIQFNDYRNSIFINFINSKNEIKQIGVVCYENQIIQKENAKYNLFGLSLDLLKYKPGNNYKCYVSIQDNKIEQWT